MSCEDFEDDVVELARDEASGKGEREEALAHAEACVRCAARLEDERAVTSGLRAFAARTAGAEAPPRVEAALLRALRDPEGVEQAATARPPRPVALLLLAAAAAILAAIVLLPPRSGRWYEAVPGALPAPTTEAAAPETGVAETGAAENAEFVSLSYGEDLRELDSLQVVSVELPRTALAALGWAAADSAQTESVRAEVIVGHDGVARAIRFED
jgi:hypothetical protein